MTGRRRFRRGAGQALAALLWAVALLCLLWTWPPLGAKFALLAAALAQLVWLQSVKWRNGPERERMRMAATVYAHSREGVIIADADHNIVMVNPAFTAITGYAEAEALGRNPRMLSSGMQDAAFYSEMWETIEREGSWQGELWNRRRDGTLYAESLSITRVTDDEGQIRNYVSIFSDITERRRAEQQIHRLAHYDVLTGLPNRALLVDRAAQALSLSRRTEDPLALMFLDLDHFKEINDTLGHRIGDLLLVAVAERLLSAVREHDTVSRQGGDEFVIILPGTSAEGAAHVAAKICGLIAQPFEVEQHSLCVTTSIGVAMFPEHAADFDSLARAADAAMYRAKREGRNRYCFHATPDEACGQAGEKAGQGSGGKGPAP